MKIFSVLFIAIMGNLLACSNREEVTRLQVENKQLVERNEALSHEIKQLKSEFKSLYIRDASFMLARAEQLMELGRAEQAMKLLHQMETAFPESKETAVAKRTVEKLQAQVKERELHELVSAYWSSMKGTFNSKLAANSSGTATDIKGRQSDLEISVTHSACDNYDSILLSFAIVCDRERNWDAIKQSFKRIVLTLNCSGKIQQYYVPMGTVVRYHSNTMSDFTFFDAVRPL